jgi:hypothetical protein
VVAAGRLLLVEMEVELLVLRVMAVMEHYYLYQE